MVYWQWIHQNTPGSWFFISNPILHPLGTWVRTYRSSSTLVSSVKLSPSVMYTDKQIALQIHYPKSAMNFMSLLIITTWMSYLNTSEGRYTWTKLALFLSDTSWQKKFKYHHSWPPVPLMDMVNKNAHWRADLIQVQLFVLMLEYSSRKKMHYAQILMRRE